MSEFGFFLTAVGVLGFSIILYAAMVPGLDRPDPRDYPSVKRLRENKELEKWIRGQKRD